MLREISNLTDKLEGLGKATAGRGKWTEGGIRVSLACPSPSVWCESHWQIP
jgi:hypothetical protein